MAQKEISVDDFKSNFDEILYQVELGESFTVFGGGLPVADVIPSRDSRKLEVGVAIKNILSSRKPSISNQYLSEAKKKGRKY